MSKILVNTNTNGDVEMMDVRELVNQPVRTHEIKDKGSRRVRLAFAFGVLTMLALVLFTNTPALAQSKAKKDKQTEQAAQVGTKIGFVNTQRILRDSAPAKAAQKKIDQEFAKRNKELENEIKAFRKEVQQFQKDALVLPETDRNRKQRELGNKDADIQRKQREIQEDFNRRRNEEFAIIIEKANVAIKDIAEKDNYDLILQDAVTVSERVDITNKVIEALGK